MGKFLLAAGLFIVLQIGFLESAEKDKLKLFAYTTTPEEVKYHPTCMFCTPIEDDPGVIAFTRRWKIVYTPNQSYLGRTFLVPHRHFETFEEMTDEEAYEYREILRTLLPALKKTFNATHFNMAYLMNTAFRAENPDPLYKEGKPSPHFYWHILPRYDGKREFGGLTFEDPDYGNTFDLKRKKSLVGKFRSNVITSLRKNLDIVYVEQ